MCDWPNAGESASDKWQTVSYGTNFISGGSKMGFPSITHFNSLMLARLE